MTVQIVMDDREDRNFKTHFENFNCSLDVKRLNVGDFVCSQNTVVERKSRYDFESSIIDKRLFLQLQNLKLNYENVILIVEGENDANRISRSALLGTYSSLITDFKVGLFFTRNKQSTAELIHSIAKHDQVSKKVPFSIKQKKKTYNLSQTQRSVLESFPFVGPKLAKSLLEEFGSLEAAINASEVDLLKIDKVGKKKARSIRNTIESEYLTHDDPI